MTGTQLAALIRWKTGTNSTTFTDANMLPLVNVFIKEISSMIVERNNGMFLVPATFNLVLTNGGYMTVGFTEGDPGVDGLPLDDNGVCVPRTYSGAGFWTLLSGFGLASG